jgi:superfamily II DNA or RNA helicase
MLECDDQGVLREIADHYTFHVPGYRFMPSFRNKLWDGKIRLLNSRDKTIPSGLLKNLKDWCESRGYQIETHPDVGARKQEIDIPSFIDGLNLPFKPRDFQIRGLETMIKDQRRLIISPTGSGKSLISYLGCRWFLDNHEGNILMIVPTTSLVEQMAKDFEDYSKQNHWNAEENIHKIYSGKEKVGFTGRIVITTWQSIFRMQKGWFDSFRMAICDEAHTAKAKSLNTIMGNLSKAWIRIGTTGTLDGTQVHELVLTGHFGEPLNVTSTKELIENQTLAELNIQCLVMKYSDEVRKTFGKKKYQEEIDFLVSNEARNRFIQNLTLDQKGNTLVLYNLVEKHGKPLYEKLKKSAKDREVYFVSGAVSADQRELIRELTETQRNTIIVASLGTFSTGINIRNLNNIIFAAPTKSQIKVLQSIGRGLRRPEDGKPTTVYDISDNLSWKRRKNYTMNHAVERIKIYESQEFSYRLYEVPIN